MASQLSVLLDTNFLLDVLLQRHPFVVLASRVWSAIDEDRIVGFVSSLSLATLFYVGTNERQKVQKLSAMTAMAEARKDVEICVSAFRVCSVSYQVIRDALAMPGSDLEDNIQLACTYKYRLEAIVSRDKKFAGASMPVWSHADILKRIKLTLRALPFHPFGS
jgi:predicted nucleic acid-binding protein